jgi:hypothetical protein
VAKSNNNQSIKIMNTTKQSIANKFAMSYIKGLLSRKADDAPLARLSAQIEYNQPSILDDLGVKTSGKKVIAEIIEMATAVVKQEIRMQADKGEDNLKKAIAANHKAREAVKKEFAKHDDDWSDLIINEPSRYAVIEERINALGDRYVHNWWTGYHWAGAQATKMRSWTEKYALKHMRAAKEFAVGEVKLIPTAQ